VLCIDTHWKLFTGCSVFAPTPSDALPLLKAVLQPAMQPFSFAALHPSYQATLQQLALDLSKPAGGGEPDRAKAKLSVYDCDTYILRRPEDFKPVEIKNCKAPEGEEFEVARLREEDAPIVDCECPAILSMHC
jgi:hypothetical protein